MYMSTITYVFVHFLSFFISQSSFILRRNKPAAGNKYTYCQSMLSECKKETLFSFRGSICLLVYKNKLL